MNTHNNNKNKNNIKIHGVKEFKPSLLNNLKSGFVGFDSLISNGRHLYTGKSHKIAVNHAYTNFASCIRQEFQSDCKEFNNLALCFDEEQLKGLIICLAAAGITDKIFIHDLTLSRVLKGNCHSVSITNSVNFISDLLIEDSSFEFQDIHLSTLNEAIGTIVTSSTVLPLSFIEIVNNIDFFLLSTCMSSTQIECYKYDDLIKSGVINIFLCDPDLSDCSGKKTPLQISKAFARRTMKNKMKSRLLIADIECLNNTRDFVDNILSKDGSSYNLFKEVYAVSRNCMKSFTDLDEPMLENRPEHYLLSQLGIDNLYIHKKEGDVSPKFDAFYTVGDAICSQSSLVSKCVYDIVTDHIEFEIN